MAFLGRYNIHHRRDNGLIRSRVCSKCKRKFSLLSHIFGLNYYHVSVNRERKAKRIQELIHSGKLTNRFPKLGPIGWYATIVGESLPKVSRWIRILVTVVVIGSIIVTLLTVL